MVATNNLLVDTDGDPVCPADLTDPVLIENFNELRDALTALLASEIACAGDGNLDKRVDLRDVVGLVQNMGQPSVFDLNADGFTDEVDLLCVLANFGNVCSALDAAVPCAGISGACWFSDTRTCVILTDADCTGPGGTYQGDGTIHCCPCDDPSDPSCSCS